MVKARTTNLNSDNNLKKPTIPFQLLYYHLMFLVMPFLFWKTKLKVSTHQGKIIGLLFFLFLFTILFLFKKVHLHFEDLSPITLYSGSLYLAWLLLTRFLGESPEGFWLNDNGRSEGMLAILLYFAVFLIARSAENLKDSFWVQLCIITTISCLLRLSEFYNAYVDSPSQAIIGVPKNFLTGAFAEFPVAFFGNRNFFGSYLCLMLPITIYLLFFRKKRWVSIVLIIQLWTLVINKTRSAFLGLAVGISCLFILMFSFYGRKFGKKSILKILLFSGLIISLGLLGLNRYFPQSWQRFTSIYIEARKFFLLEDNFTRLGSGRVELWMITLTMIRALPIFGTGLGAFSLVSQNYLPPIYIKRTRHEFLSEAHNEYLQIAARTGIPSLLFWLVFMCSNLYQGLQRMKESPAYVLVFSSVVGYMVQAFFNISVPDNAWILFFFLGLLSRPGTLAPVDFSSGKSEQSKNFKKITLENSPTI